MSGEKCSSISIRVAQAAQLEEENRRREDAERKELLELERREVRLIATREILKEKEKRRLELLREKEKERQKREAERQSRLAMLAEQERKLELANYNRLREHLAAAISARSELESEFPGITLPDPPNAMPDLDESSDISSIRATVSNIRVIAGEYQRKVDAALLHHRKTLKEMQAWSAQFKARAIRSAKDVIAALEPDSLFVSGSQRTIRLEGIVKTAKNIIASVISDSSDYDLSEKTMTMLDSIMSSDNESDAQVKIEQLRQEISVDRKRRDEAIRQHERILKDKDEIERVEKMRIVASHVANTLEDMGYNVSGIDETAFVEERHLYAYKKDWSDHVLRFAFNPATGKMTSAPLRVADEAQSVPEADRKLRLDEDANFDSQWCGPDGISKLKDILGSRGIDMSFSLDNPPGKVALATVPEATLGQELIGLRRETDESKKLKARLKE